MSKRGVKISVRGSGKGFEMTIQKDHRYSGIGFSGNRVTIDKATSNFHPRDGFLPYNMDLSCFPTDVVKDISINTNTREIFVGGESKGYISEKTGKILTAYERSLEIEAEMDNDPKW